jgi:hypothetical protein
MSERELARKGPGTEPVCSTKATLMDDPATVEALSAPIQVLRREVSNEECLAKRVHCQELAAQAEDLSVKLLYLDLANLWQAIRQDMAEAGPHTMAAASLQRACNQDLPLCDSPQLA